MDRQYLVLVNKHSEKLHSKCPYLSCHSFLCLNLPCSDDYRHLHDGVNGVGKITKIQLNIYSGVGN